MTGAIITSVLLATLLLQGCTSTQFNPRSKDDHASGNGSDNSNEDKKPRPTDEGEGVPGYLVDPDMVNVDRSETTDLFTFSGAPNSIDNQEHKPEKSFVYVWKVKEDDFQEIFSGRITQGTVNGKLLASQTINGDGSFSVSGNENYLTPLVVTFIGSGKDDELTLSPSINGGETVVGQMFPETTVVSAHGGKSGWSEAELAEATSNHADKLKTYWNLLSDDEENGFVRCFLLAQSTIQSYGQFKADPDRNIDASIQRGLDAYCLEQALTIYTKDPGAFTPQNSWTKREVDWSISSCMASSSSRSICTCQTNVLSNEYTFSGFWGSDYSERQHILNNPPVSSNCF